MKIKAEIQVIVTRDDLQDDCKESELKDITLQYFKPQPIFEQAPFIVFVETTGFKILKDFWYTREGRYDKIEAKKSIIKITKFLSQKENIISEVIPDGVYKGYWGNFDISLRLGGNSYLLTTDTGTRGYNIPVIVEFENGVGTFKQLNN